MEIAEEEYREMVGRITELERVVYEMRRAIILLGGKI